MVILTIFYYTLMQFVLIFMRMRMDGLIMCILLLLFSLAEGAMVDVHVSVASFSVTKGYMTCTTNLNKSALSHATTASYG